MRLRHPSSALARQLHCHRTPATITAAAIHLPRQHTITRTFASAPSTSKSSSSIGAPRKYQGVQPIQRNVAKAGDSSTSEDALSEQFIPASDISSNVRPGGRASVSGVTATVFGCSGFLGRYIVQDLGDIGTQVIVPYRGDGFNTRHLRLAGGLGQIVPVPYDLTDVESITRTLARSNVVINLIGKNMATPNYSMHDTNVKITYQLAKAAKEAGVERFIHVSHINADVNSESEFFRTKGEAEQVVRHFFPNATILKPATLFGREDIFIHLYASLGVELFSVPVTNSGSKLYAPVYVEDVSRAILNSIVFGETAGQTYYLAGPETYSELELIEKIADHMYAPIRTTNLPDWLARIYAAVIAGDRTVKLPGVDPNSGIMKVINKLTNRFRSPQMFQRDRIYQNHYNEFVPRRVKTFADLDIQPTTLLTQLDSILLPHKRTRGPDRYLDLGDKPSAASPL